MDIVYSCNEKFAVHTAVSITSLFENNKEAESINVYILGNGLGGGSISGFERLAAAYSGPGHADGVYGANGADGTEHADGGKGGKGGKGGFPSRKISLIDLKDYGSALKILFGNGMNTGSFDATVLARIFAASNLPDEVERYIYLDADTVVTGNIRELYDTGLDGKVCAMAAEPTIYPGTKEKLGLGKDEPYFNSGMMLVDRAAWEEQQICGKSIDYYKSCGGKWLSFPDQDIINHVLKGKIKPVWQGYNFFSNYYYRSYESLVKSASWYGRLSSLKDYERARRAPAVVHFAGGERPWYRGSRNPYKAEYDKYLELSPWRGTKEQPGHEKSMTAYHLMNLITKYCPPVRRLVSSLYYRYKFRGEE